MKSDEGRQKQSCAGFLFWGMITAETDVRNPTFTELSHVRLSVRPFRIQRPRRSYRPSWITCPLVSSPPGGRLLTADFSSFFF